MREVKCVPSSKISLESTLHGCVAGPGGIKQPNINKIHCPYSVRAFLSKSVSNGIKHLVWTYRVLGFRGHRNEQGTVRSLISYGNTEGLNVYIRNLLWGGGPRAEGS